MQILDKFEDIEIQQWSQFVSNHPNGNIFQTPQMYEIYDNTKNYEPIFVSATDKGKILGILLAVIQKDFSNPMGFLTSRSVIWGGPLVLDNDRSVLNILLNNYLELVDGKAIYSQIRNMSSKRSIKKDIEHHGFQYEDHLNYIIDLSRGADKVWNEMHKKRRNSIRKSLNFRTQVTIVRNPQELSNSYHILKKLYKRIGIPLPDYTLFSNTFKELFLDDKVFCLNAICQEKTIGTMWIFHYNDTSYNWYLGSDKDYADKNLNDLLMWKAIKLSVAKGMLYFDLGGAGKPDQKYGVRDYKKKFGGKEVNDGRFNLTHHNVLYKIMFSLLKIKNKIGV